jgi:ABC-type transport system involved in cytochrome c biogenesis ATPase subunit
MTKAPVGRNFLLHIETDVTFKRGAINLILGPTGSGKTSMLLALLGKLGLPSWGMFSNVLPKARCISYPRVLTPVLIFLGKMASLMLLKKVGSRTTPSR